MIAKAASSNADLVMLDLEDSVAPSEKVAARGNVIAGLRDHDWSTTTRAFRINGVHTPWCHDDLVEVVTGAGGHIDVVVVPKITAPRDIWFVEDLLSQLELKLGLQSGSIGIEVLIEEAEALARVEEIARCSPRLEALILGMGDLGASQGMRVGHIGVTSGLPYPGDVWHYARTRMVVAARASGIDAVEGPFADLSDPAGFERSAAEFSLLGGVGKWCVHPSQVAIANEVFAPTREEIERAAAVVQEVRDAQARGAGVASLDGVMIDAATLRAFEGTLERAAQCGLSPRST